MATTPPPVQIQKKRTSGCFGCGCAFALFVVFVILVVAAIGYFGYKAALTYTDVTAKPVPQADGGDDVYNTAHQKVATFEDAIERNQSASLHLNTAEINTLIARDPSYEKLRGHVFVALKDSEATIQASVPLSAIEQVFLTDRFVNFNAALGLTFDASTKAINFDLHSLSLKDQDLPPNFAQSFNQTFNASFNSKLQSNPAAHDFLNRTKNITIENSELVIETQ